MYASPINQAPSYKRSRNLVKNDASVSLKALANLFAKRIEKRRLFFVGDG